MRAMALEFPGDRTCLYLDRQYMLGDNLLVAPVMNDRGVGEYYLPKGRWTNFFTNEQREGGGWQEDVCGYCDIPLWVRPGSVVALGSRDDTPEYDYARDVTFRVYVLEDGEEGGTKVYGTDGEQKLQFTARRQGGLLTLSCRGEGTYTVELIGITGLSVQGAAMEVQKDRTVLTGCQSEMAVRIEEGRN